MSLVFTYSCSHLADQDFESIQTETSPLFKIGSTCPIELPCVEEYTGIGCAVYLSGSEVEAMFLGIAQDAGINCEVTDIVIDFQMTEDQINKGGFTFSSTIGANSPGMISVQQNGNPVNWPNMNAIRINCGETYKFTVSFESNGEKCSSESLCTSFELSCADGCGSCEPDPCEDCDGVAVGLGYNMSTDENGNACCTLTFRLFDHHGCEDDVEKYIAIDGGPFTLVPGGSPYEMSFTDCDENNVISYRARFVGNCISETWWVPNNCH